MKSNDDAFLDLRKIPEEVPTTVPCNVRQIWGLELFHIPWVIFIFLWRLSVFLSRLWLEETMPWHPPQKMMNFGIHKEVWELNSENLESP